MLLLGYNYIIAMYLLSIYYDIIGMTKERYYTNKKSTPEIHPECPCII